MQAYPRPQFSLRLSLDILIFAFCLPRFVTPRILHIAYIITGMLLIFVLLSCLSIAIADAVRRLADADFKCKPVLYILHLIFFCQQIDSQ